jgi:hypothetical protein
MNLGIHQNRGVYNETKFWSRITFLFGVILACNEQRLKKN